MRDRLDEFGDAEVVVVTFTQPRNLAGYRRRFADPLRVVSDPDRTVYDALGFDRGSIRRVWGWRAARRYLELMRSGRRPDPIREDTLQLGGNAVLDPNGRLVWQFAGAGPDDRPSVDDLLGAVNSARTGGG